MLLLCARTSMLLDLAPHCPLGIPSLLHHQISKNVITTNNHSNPFACTAMNVHVQFSVIFVVIILTTIHCAVMFMYCNE